MDWYAAANEYYQRTLPHDGQLSALPDEWQREMVALMLVTQEVNNGGYLQFLANCGAEKCELARQALEAIGARRASEIMDQCNALLEEHCPPEEWFHDDLVMLMPNAVIGRDGETKKEAGSILPEPVLTRVHGLSHEFMDASDEIGRLAQCHYGPMIAGERQASGKAEVPFWVILLVNLLAAYLPTLFCVVGLPSENKVLTLLYGPVLFLALLSAADLALATCWLLGFFAIVVALSRFAARKRLIDMRIVGALFFYSLFQSLFVAVLVAGFRGLGHV